MAERLAYDIARDLRARGPWPSEKLLIEAADKLEGLIELLAQAECERDQARADGRSAATPDSGEWTTEYGLINENTREFVPFSSWTEAEAFAQGRQVMRRQVWRGQVFEAREGGRPVEPIPAPDDNTEAGRG